VNLLCCSDVLEAFGECCLVYHEHILDLCMDLLRQFIEHELDVGVHGAKDVLLAAHVVEQVHRGLRSNNLIPNVSLSTLN
jgi:hypothetical protein